MHEGLLLFRSERGETRTLGEAGHHHRVREAHAREASLRHATHELRDLLLDGYLGRLRDGKVANFSGDLGHFFLDNGGLRGCHRLLLLLRLLSGCAHHSGGRCLNNLFH